MGEPARMGHIDFLNCLPLTYSLKTDGPAPDMDVYAAAPAELNRRIVDGSLDISPVSSIVYARHSEQLLLLPGVSITADGDVQSIVLVSRRPIGALDRAKIVLTAKSATSHCLLKIVLRRAYGISPAYDVRMPDLKQIIPDDAAAMLLIGDDALYAHHHREPGLYYYDIGREWKKLTGLRMVYAVWVVNRAFARARPALVRRAHQSVTRGFADGYRRKARAIAMVRGRTPFSAAELDDYLEVIKWDFGPAHADALRTFYVLAHEQALIDRVPDLAFAAVGL